MVDEHGRMRGLASRIQWGDNWRSFTVRLERRTGLKTEKEKRISAFLQPQAGWLLPALTIQAYLTRPKPGGHLIEAGVIRTADLLDHMIRNPCPRARRDPEDGVMFEPYFWDDLAGLGRERSRQDRKSTRLNSSHANISYAVFCLKKKKHSYAAKPCSCRNDGNFV